MKIAISSPALLVLVLIFLKAVGAITLSWWWVLFPIWFPLSVAAVIIFIIGAMCVYIGLKD